MLKHKLLPILMIGASLPISTLANEEAPKKLWSGAIDFGYVSLSGNTEETTTHGKIAVKRTNAPWTYKLTAEGSSSETDSDRTAEKYGINNRLEYRFTESSYAFGRASYEEDHFSGFDSQASATLGAGHTVLNTDTMHWDIEAGLGYRVNKVDKNSTAEDDEEAIIRLGTLYNWQLSETADFSQEVSVETGDSNTISLSETALNIQVINEIFLKLSYVLKYTEETPDDKKHADTETRISLSYKF